MKLLICGLKVHVGNHVPAWPDQTFKLLVRDAALSNPINSIKSERSLLKLGRSKLPTEPMLISTPNHSLIVLAITLKIIPVHLQTMDHLMLIASQSELY